MNVGRRFWAADNTDINRMFPGYDQGETTQRIAARIFSAIQGYRYGIHLTSLYLPGDLLPHVRIMETGYQHEEEALAFGLPYVLLRTPQPYDTTTLNYNWQIWDTQAFSLYTHETESVDLTAAQQAVDAILRFLCAKGLSRREIPSPETAPVLFREDGLHNVLSSAGRPASAPPQAGGYGTVRRRTGGDSAPRHMYSIGAASGRLPRQAVLLPPRAIDQWSRSGFPYPARRIDSSTAC